MSLALVLISCIMFILVVRAFARSWGERPREHLRAAEDPDDESWLHVDEVAELLETRPAEVVVLVLRDSIPFYVDPRIERSDPAAYLFRRDEIDDWVIG